MPGCPAVLGEAWPRPSVGLIEAWGVIRTNGPLGRQLVRLCVSHGQPWIDTHGPHIPAANVRGAVAVRRERGQSTTGGESGDEFGAGEGRMENGEWTQRVSVAPFDDTITKTGKREAIAGVAAVQ